MKAALAAAATLEEFHVGCACAISCCEYAWYALECHDPLSVFSAHTVVNASKSKTPLRDAVALGSQSLTVVSSVVKCSDRFMACGTPPLMAREPSRRGKAPWDQDLHAGSAQPLPVAVRRGSSKPHVLPTSTGGGVPSPMFLRQCGGAGVRQCGSTQT